MVSGCSEFCRKSDDSKNLFCLIWHCNYSLHGLVFTRAYGTKQNCNLFICTSVIGCFLSEHLICPLMNRRDHYNVCPKTTDPLTAFPSISFPVQFLTSVSRGRDGRIAHYNYRRVKVLLAPSLNTHKMSPENVMLLFTFSYSGVPRLKPLRNQYFTFFSFFCRYVSQLSAGEGGGRCWAREGESRYQHCVFAEA